MRIPLRWTLPAAVTAAALASATAPPAHAVAGLPPAARRPPPAARRPPPAARTPHELAFTHSHDGVQWPMYIVTVDQGQDPAAVARMHGIRPAHIYRSALNGFSARLSPTKAAAFQATPGLDARQPRGTGPVEAARDRTRPA
ncbi:hypothetical protein NJL88_29030 [Streptomyces sp. DK15]|uniref:hypothetical protein n=1 Tax=Streptomyces sp. DK15 TaxID=2957499 RepID=UPI0029A81A4E|nr:hypothetical protein [Streptomyces sp. DK15]MDX2394036.1 hypothetical protein [Streptomyces sp. DK15]